MAGYNDVNSCKSYVRVFDVTYLLLGIGKGVGSWCPCNFVSITRQGLKRNELFCSMGMIGFGSFDFRNGIRDPELG
jgi:hypothetical protein